MVSQNITNKISMKYIKTYENIPTPKISDSIKESNFKLGDYIVADNDTFRCENEKVKHFFKNNIGVVMDIALRSHDIDYNVLPSYINDKSINRIVVRKNKINTLSVVFYVEDIRLATLEEIEEFERMKKYNL